jgi:hypothetical protein
MEGNKCGILTDCWREKKKGEREVSTTRGRSGKIESERKMDEYRAE